MRRLALVMCGGFFAAATVTAALAADLPAPPYKAPVYGPSYSAPVVAPPAFSWSGYYAGIVGGYGFGASEWSNVASDSFAVDGGLIGVTMGYNMQTGVWVWGLEGDIAYSWIKGSDSNPGSGGVCGGSAGCETRNTWLATARGRIGYAFDRWLPYFTGGGAFGNVKMTPSSGVSESETRFGWTLGAGIEYAFISNWSARLEYLYADLGKASCSAAACGVDTDVTLDTSIVRVGLNYRF